MLTQRAKRIPEKDWLTHQQTLKRLWLEEKREMLGEEGVVETMMTRHDFFASKSQYEARFKIWKWSKNQKKAAWEQLSAVIYERQCQGKESEVYVRGKLLAPEKVCKEIARYSLSIPQRLAFPLAPQLPKSIAVRSPVLDRTSSLTLDLPFREFEKCLRIESNRPGQQIFAWPNLPQTINPRLTVKDVSNAEAWNHGGFIEGFETLEQHPSVDATSTADTVLDIWTAGSPAFTALKSVLPKSIEEENITGSSLISPGTQIFTSPLHRQILFSVANNFAGLGEFSTGDVIRFLQKETNQMLYQLIRLAPGYSSRAMRQNIFKGAIEAGDARIVELLLSEKFADIDVNQQVCLIEGRRYTPIERASILRHKDVIESLLRHHADVNRTHPDDQYLYGALDYAVPIGTVEYLGPTRVDHHIFRILLEAGGDLSLYPMQRLIKHEGDRGLVLLFISANAHRNVAKWSEWGMFHYAIDFLDDQTSMSIINIMLTVGADLNHHAKRDYLNLIYDVEGGKVNATCNLVDTAAQCGHLETVKLLLRHGALLTGDTLPCAVTSGNEDLMRLLLEEGAAINSIGSLGITPLAAAIRLQNERIVKLLKSHDALARLSDQAHFSAAMKAASEVGNIPFIEYLMQLGCKVSPEDLGYALITATREGREDFARMLIDAGADVNFDHFNEPPLLQVLKRRNAALVHLLLDADASFNMFSLEMQLAAEWGDHSVIEALIFAGADVNNFGSSSGSKAALTIAVTHQDHVLVQLLLDAGADINNTKTRLNGGTALEAAAENGDVSTARYLLDQGADPDDSRALSSATLRNAKLSDLIIERYSLRYPKGRTGFGSSVLLQAVKKGDQPAIRMMLERGLDANKLIDIDAPCHYGSLISPFGCAIVEEQVSSAESIELFLQKGCNPDGIVSQTEDWRLLLRVTALLAAVGTRNISKVELLIRYGADVNLPARGPVKRTPLQRAAEIGSIDVVELLVHNGAEVNAPAAERGGGTALQFAAIGGYFPIACTLLNLKADVDAPASKVNGRTALEGAAEHGRLDMVKFLLNKGAGSGGKDHAQFVRAIALARDNGHIPICDLLETQLAVLADFNVNDFMDWSEGRDYFSN